MIIVGYGTNGRNLSRVLARNDIAFLIVEVKPEVVRAERARGHQILYGDATRAEVLPPAGVARARVIVVAISDAAATRRVVGIARRANPRLHIVVRIRYLREITELYALGADEVVVEEFETSIEIFSRVLARYSVAAADVEHSAREVRRDAYDLLRRDGASGRMAIEVSPPQDGR